MKALAKSILGAKAPSEEIFEAAFERYSIEMK
jgi:hypothetical protein